MIPISDFIQSTFRQFNNRLKLRSRSRDYSDYPLPITHLSESRLPANKGRD